MKFTFDGETYEMVQENITFAEGRAFEKVTGHSFMKMMSDPELQMSMVALQAITWISMKRKNPTLLFDDLNDLDVSAIEYEAEEGEDSAAPLDDAGDPPATPSLISA